MVVRRRKYLSTPNTDWRAMFKGAAGRLSTAESLRASLPRSRAARDQREQHAVEIAEKLHFEAASKKQVLELLSPISAEMVMRRDMSAPHPGIGRDPHQQRSTRLQSPVD
jgi:hypothetical protein